MVLSGLKGLIPGTAAYSQKHHVKYLRKKAKGHDVLLLVEWEDGQLTELGADLHPEMDGWYKATNGLFFAPAGEGTDPMQYYGVPTIRCHAQIACPFSTEACLAADMDEAGEFQYNVDRDSGTTQQVVEVEMEGANGTPEQPAAETSNGHDGAAADGGGQVVREYDLRPPSGAVGYSFSLDQAKQRAPNAISANMIKRAVEYGKQMAREEGLYMRGLLHGAGLIIGTIVILALLYIIGASVLGGGGGGGGGESAGTTLGLLLLAVTPARDKLRDEINELWTSVKEDPKESAYRALQILFGSLSAAALWMGYVLAMLTGGVFWGQWFDAHPEIASEQTQWFFGETTRAAAVGDLFTWALVAPVFVAGYILLRDLQPVLFGDDSEEDTSQPTAQGGD